MRVSRSPLVFGCLLALVLTAVMSAACARPDDLSVDVIQLFQEEPVPTDVAHVEEEPPPPPAVGLLDGIPFGETDALAGARPPVAVMIDNLPGGSRPQIGLDRADLVFELLVEGGITRFMAIYLHHDAGVIEPVRSARTPSVLFARELGAVMAHAGSAELDGDADAAQQLYDLGVPHIDYDADRQPFWLDRRRFPPHNVATSTELIRNRAADWGVTEPSAAASWLFKDDHAETNLISAAAQHVSYNFALRVGVQPAFAGGWTYDAGSNSYRRAMAGVPHVDGLTGNQLTFKNVVLQVMPARIASREGHVVYSQIGEGQAYVFLDGRMIDAVWSKASPEDRTRYWYRNGAEVQFNRGATWIALIPTGSPYSWR
ncbi:MAG: DUF3048 domain-containing protein [Dehalococcoidia bacterium]